MSEHPNTRASAEALPPRYIEKTSGPSGLAQQQRELAEPRDITIARDLIKMGVPVFVARPELFIGTMHGYARDLLQTYVPLTFKRNVLSDIQTRLFIDRHSRASGLTVTDAVVNGVPKKLKR